MRPIIGVLVVLLIASFGLMPSTAIAQTPTPTHNASDKAVLVTLYNATDGPGWTNNTNWLSDRPIGDWHGVTTDATGRVVELDLGSNGLFGQLPSELGNLENLKRLGLSDNQLYGNIPSALGSLENLVSLDLSSNHLMGYMPPELGHLSYVDDIALAGNGLLGCIPEGLRSVTDNDFNRMLLPFCDNQERALESFNRALDSLDLTEPSPRPRSTLTPVSVPTPARAPVLAQAAEPEATQSQTFAPMPPPPAPTPEVERGFFTNSLPAASGADAGLPFDIMDPVTLSLIGVLVTLGATTIQLFRGR